MSSHSSNLKYKINNKIDGSNVEIFIDEGLGDLKTENEKMRYI